MSRDTRFSRVTFPALPSCAQDALETQARASGHAAGYAAGLRAAAKEVAAKTAMLEAEQAASVLHQRARVDRAVTLLASAAMALDSRAVAVLAEAQDVIAACTIELAEAILGVELNDGSTSARSALTRALAGVDASTVITVRMNPLDLTVLDESVRAESGVRFTADASLARGDAITELPVGYLDAAIGTAVMRARTAILGGSA